MEGGQSWPGVPLWGRLIGGQSRLKAGCGQNCPPSKLGHSVSLTAAADPETDLPSGVRVHFLNQLIM